MTQLNINRFDLSNYTNLNLALPLIWITLWLVIISNLSTVWPQIRLTTLISNLLTVEGIVAILENLLQIF